MLISRVRQLGRRVLELVLLVFKLKLSLLALLAHKDFCLGRLAVVYHIHLSWKSFHRTRQLHRIFWCKNIRRRKLRRHRQLLQRAWGKSRQMTKWTPRHPRTHRLLNHHGLKCPIMYEHGRNGSTTLCLWLFKFRFKNLGFHLEFIEPFQSFHVLGIAWEWRQQRQRLLDYHRWSAPVSGTSHFDTVFGRLL